LKATEKTTRVLHMVHCSKHSEWLIYYCYW